MEALVILSFLGVLALMGVTAFQNGAASNKYAASFQTDYPSEFGRFVNLYMNGGLKKPYFGFNSILGYSPGRIPPHRKVDVVDEELDAVVEKMRRRSYIMVGVAISWFLIFFFLG